MEQLSIMYKSVQLPTTVKNTWKSATLELASVIIQRKEYRKVNSYFTPVISLFKMATYLTLVILQKISKVNLEKNH
jgi:hypothetical protein